VLSIGEIGMSFWFFFNSVRAPPCGPTRQLRAQEGLFSKKMTFSDTHASAQFLAKPFLEH
jgi:hypothetical protein